MINNWWSNKLRYVYDFIRINHIVLISTGFFLYRPAGLLKIDTRNRRSHESRDRITINIF